jgi:hypothetical protein
MTDHTGRLRVLPGLRIGNVLTAPTDPDAHNPEMLGAIVLPCSDQECGEGARWTITACPGTGHESCVYTCDAHLATVHRSMLEDVACRPHQHEGSSSR